MPTEATLSKPRPPLVQLMALAAWLGVASGCLEVGLRAAPVLGMRAGDVSQWLAVSVTLSFGYLAVSAVVAWLVGVRAIGLVVAALVGVHLALWYRFEVVLNAFFAEPRVWGGLLAIGAGALVFGVLVDPWVRRMSRWVVLAAGGLIAVGMVMAFARGRVPHGAERGGRPNVVVVTIDTLRADAVGAFSATLADGGPNRTPVLDRLAQEGVRFTVAVATAPLTEPSHLAILSGLPPHASGVVSNGTALGDRPALLARAFQDRGWSTAGFVAGFPLHGKYGWRQGMDVYDDDFGSLRGLHRLTLVKAIDQFVLPGHTLRERRADSVMNRVLPWLDDHEDEAFFLWVHLFDPHGPYEAPGHPFDPPTDGAVLELPGYWPPPHRAITSERWLVEAYQAEVTFADAQIGRLIDAIEERGILDDTLVVVTSDHGESLTEHGTLFDHGDDLYDPSLRVPLIVRYPGAVRPGSQVDCQVGTIDVAPTVLDLVGIDDGIARPGRSRAAELAGAPCAEEPVVATTVGGRFVENPPIDHALRTGGHKVIEKGAGGVECFDLMGDPGELADLGAACPASLLPTLRGALAGGVVPDAPQMDDATLEALESLGYL